jgi:hypothetical protein
MATARREIHAPGGTMRAKPNIVAIAHRAFAQGSSGVCAARPGQAQQSVFVERRRP